MTTPQAPKTPETPATEALVDTNKLVAERREKLAAIRAQGVAFPNDFKPTDRAANLHAAHDGTDAEVLEGQAVKASVGGRLMLKRVMGKACFGTLQDATGRIQVYVTLDNVGVSSTDASTTATYSSTTTNGCGTRITPRQSAIWRRKTPIPNSRLLT